MQLFVVLFLVAFFTAPAMAQQPQTAPRPQPSPQPAQQPAPIETPIGTEAATLELQPHLPPQRIVVPAVINFRIASWNLAAREAGDQDQPPQQPTTAPAAKAKVWRHTFGAERTTPQAQHGLAAIKLSADIVALQGVNRPAAIRRTLNARRFQIVTSRQLLARSAANSTGYAIFRSDAPPTTAIAIRRRRGIRMAGFRHFLPAPARQSDEPAAITAIRLRFHGRMLWIASIDISDTCRQKSTSTACDLQADMLQRFIEWGQSIARKTPLMMLGRWPSGTAKLLADQAIKIAHGTAGPTKCSPLQSGILVAHPDTIAPPQIDDIGSAKSNQCIATGMLALKLR